MTELDASEARLLALLEAVTFVSPEPIPLTHLAYALGETPERIRTPIASRRNWLNRTTA